MLKGYPATDKGLLNFANDFAIFVDQILNNKEYHFKYTDYKSHEAVSMHLFEQLCNGRYEDIEGTDQIEYKWIEKCHNGGLRYCKRGKHTCYGYDYSSQFPSILAMEHFKIPTKRGKEHTITKLRYPEIEIGFYKVRITSNDVNFNKIWAYSEDNVYTNISLMFAFKCQQKEKMNVKIELINEENNCYIYDSEDLRGSIFSL